MTDGPVTVVDMLLFEIGEAVRKGMDPVRALAMVTSNAAKIVGVEDRVGSKNLPQVALSWRTCRTGLRCHARTVQNMGVRASYN